MSRRAFARTVAAAGGSTAAAALLLGERAAGADVTPAPVVVVATVAELAAAGPALVAVAAGYWAAGDGGGGVFRADPASTTAPDGGTVFARGPGLPGRWLRAYDPPIDARWFGAGGAGPADADTKGIQAALDAAARMGEAVYLGRGVKKPDYVVRATITLPAGTTLFADGATVQEAVRTAQGRGGTMFLVRGNGVTLRGLRVTQELGTRLAADVIAVHVVGSPEDPETTYVRDFACDDCTFTDLTEVAQLNKQGVRPFQSRVLEMQYVNGFRVTGAVVRPTIYDGRTMATSGLAVHCLDVRNGLISGGRFLDTGWCSILLNTRCSDVTISDVVITGRNPDARDQGGSITIGGGSGGGMNERITVTGCDVSGPTRYTAAGGVLVGSTDGITIAHCRFRDISQTQVVSVGARPPYPGSRRVIITGNEILTNDRNWTGIYVHNVQPPGSAGPALRSSAVIVTDNVVARSAGGVCSGGIWVNGSTGGMDDVVVRGNVVEGHGFNSSFPGPERPPSIGSLLVTSVDNAIVEGNHVRFAGAGPPGQSAYGINVADRNAGVTIRDNVVTGFRVGLATSANSTNLRHLADNDIVPGAGGQRTAVSGVQTAGHLAGSQAITGSSVAGGVQATFAIPVPGVAPVTDPARALSTVVSAPAGTDPRLTWAGSVSAAGVVTVVIHNHGTVEIAYNGVWTAACLLLELRP